MSSGAGRLKSIWLKIAFPRLSCNSGSECKLEHLLRAWKAEMRQRPLPTATAISAGRHGHGGQQCPSPQGQPPQRQAAVS